MKLFTLDEKKHLLNDLEIFTENKRGDHRRHFHLQRGHHRQISKNSKSASNPSKLLWYQKLFLSWNYLLWTQKNIFWMIKKFSHKTKEGTTGVTCTCKGGTTGKFQKIQKVLQTLQNFYDIIKNYFFHEIIYFGRKKTSFEWFRNFHTKPKGGPQASLELGKEGPQKNFKKFKKCFKPFKTFRISSKTISFIRLFTLDAKKHLLNDLEIFTQNQRGDHRRHLHLQRGTDIDTRVKLRKPIFKGLIYCHMQELNFNYEKTNL